MFDPISARFASSFSRKGTSDAATDTSCFSDTSMKSTSSRLDRMKFPCFLAFTRSDTTWRIIELDVGLRDDAFGLLHADR